MSELHGGTVTFLFTDVEGSTRLLQALGDEGYATVSRDHRRLVRDALAAHGGREVDTQGDAFFYSFARARAAVEGAVAAQRALRAHAWPDGVEVKVRMGLHTGEPQIGDEGYLGIDVVRAARISSAGTGGQILISETTRALLGNRLPDGVSVHDLGSRTLKDIQHEHVYEVAVDGRVAGAAPASTVSSQKPDLAATFEQRIQSYVEQRLERALAGDAQGDELTSVTRLAVGGTALGLGLLVLLVVAIVVIVLLVRLVF